MKNKYWTKEKQAEYNSRPEVKARRKEYYLENKKKLDEYQKQYHKDTEYAANKKWMENNKEQYLESIDNWRKNNIEHHRETRAEYMKEYRKNNPDYILKENVSHYIRRVLNGGKSGSYKKYLGCNIKEYKVYLENKFTDKMSWDNYGTYWEIDHIIPTSKGGSFYYTNTQPLSVKENRIKGNRYNG
tara:strand:+ start:282 stop:839 length:558 start_codon:yes stop_codon:yes gene_type:complete